MQAHTDRISVNAATTPLGGSSDARKSTLVLRGKDHGSTWNGTVTLKGKVIGGALASVPIPYRTRNLGGNPTSDDTSIFAAISSADFLIIADISGLEVELLAAVVAGALDIDWLILSS